MGKVLRQICYICSRLANETGMKCAQLRTWFLAIWFTALCLLSFQNNAPAQPSSGGGGPGPCFPPATPCIPIDGGLGFLVLAGLAFGGKKLLDRSDKNRP